MDRDDAEDYQAVAGLLQDVERAHVLILSRAAYWGRPFQVIRLAALDPAASRALVRQLAPGASDDEVAGLVTLASGSPLAISAISSMAYAPTELRRFEEQDELLSDPVKALAFLRDREPPPPGLDAARDG